MAVTIISKSASSNAYATNEKPIDMFENMMKNFSDITPLTAIFTRLERARKARRLEYALPPHIVSLCTPGHNRPGG